MGRHAYAYRPMTFLYCPERLCVGRWTRNPWNGIAVDPWTPEELASPLTRVKNVPREKRFPAANIPADDQSHWRERETRTWSRLTSAPCLVRRSKDPVTPQTLLPATVPSPRLIITSVYHKLSALNKMDNLLRTWQTASDRREELATAPVIYFRTNIRGCHLFL